MKVPIFYIRQEITLHKYSNSTNCGLSSTMEEKIDDLAHSLGSLNTNEDANQEDNLASTSGKSNTECPVDERLDSIVEARGSKFIRYEICGFVQFYYYIFSTFYVNFFRYNHLYVRSCLNF